MLMTFFLSVFGLVIGFRTSTFLVSNRFIPKRMHRSAVGFALVAMMACQFVLRHHQMALWILDVVLFLIPLMAFHLQEHLRRIDFRRNIVPILDSLIVQMRSGRTLRDSVQEIGHQHHGASAYYLGEVQSLLDFQVHHRQKSLDTFFEEILAELVEIHNSTHKSVDKMKALRRKLKTEQDFRQKSSQVTLQIRAQAFILTIVFVALMIFSLASYDFAANRKFYLLSSLLFLAGIYLNFQIPRRFRWKV